MTRQNGNTAVYYKRNTCHVALKTCFDRPQQQKRNSFHDLTTKLVVITSKCNKYKFTSSKISESLMFSFFIFNLKRYF